jgi:ATP-dependent exoDNAse (exonuclease V) beta subunit
LADHFDLQSGQCLVPLPKECQSSVVRITTEPPPTTFATQSTSRGDLDREVQRAVKLVEDGKCSDNSFGLAQPLHVDSGARRRFSISRLSGELRPSDELINSGALDDENGSLLPIAGGAELGTLVHRVLARLDLASSTDVSAVVRRCIESQMTQSDEHREAAEEMLSAFLRSPRALELAKSHSVHRELEFLLSWPPRSSKDAAADGKDANQVLYLHGFIDCLYQDAAGKWHLLDYKTNRVAADKVAAAAGLYEMQLGLYALAVEQILGQPPAELAVHFLRPSAEHRFAWDDAMRRRTVDQVNQAMAAMVNEVG